MSLRGEDALILAQDYVDETLKGAGALKGQDGKDGVSPIVSVNTSTADTYKLDITDKNGTITTPNLVGKQGEQGIQGEQGKPADNPIVTENADNTEDVYKLDLTVGETVFTTKNIIGKQGLEGVSPSVTTNPDNTAEDYRLNITTKGGTFTTPNLRGPQGEIGPQGESAASAINPRGDYDVNADPHYTISDYITSAEGNTYVCKKDNPDNVAPTDGTVNDEFWQVLALRGAKGESGKDGDKGADGVTFTPSIDKNGVLSFTNNGGLENPEPIDIKGDNGVTFTPSIDADGYLSFTNDGNLDNPEPIKVLGKDGEDGKDGIDGTTYIPSIGTVTTVESNAEASAGVTVDQETKEAVFHFEIPKGEKATQFTPSITENGELAWENDGDLPNPPTTPIQTLISTAPLGTVLSFAGSIAPNGYLLCDGKSYAVADYSDLYAVIGNTYGGDTENFNVPDYRETVLVGVGENTTDTIASHDVYELGEFKDDQFQGHWHNLGNSNGTVTVALGASIKGGSVMGADHTGENRYAVENALDAVTNGTNGEPRKGTTTHGKQKGVTYIIKAKHTNEGQDEGVSDSVIEYVDGKIIDTTTSTDTVWSSQKTSDEIDALISDTDLASTTSTLSASKIRGSVTHSFNTQDGKVKYLKLKLDINTISVVDIYGGKIEILGANNSGSNPNYKTVKVVRHSYGDWTSYDATQVPSVVSAKIGSLYYYPTDNYYYLQLNYYANFTVTGALTSPEMVTSLPAETSEMTLIPESKYASINDSATSTTSTWSSSKIASEISPKADKQSNNKNTDYLKSDRPYLKIARNRNLSPVSYYTCETYILCSHSGDMGALSFIRNDNGASCVYKNIVGTLPLSVEKYDEYTCWLKYSSTSSEIITVYALNGYTPTVSSATSMT